MANKLNFKIIYCSAEDAEHPVQELYSSNVSSRGWQTPKFCEYPQELGIQFEGAAHVNQIKFLSHQFKIASRIDLYMGIADPETPHAYNRVRWKRLGYLSLDTNERTNFQARELKTVYINAAGSFLKLIINAPHPNNKNLYSQVGLVNISILGTIQTANVDILDKVLPSVSSFGFDSVSVEVQDTQLLAKIKELNMAKAKAVDVENYELANKIKAQMEYLKSAMEEIALVEQKKATAVAREEYELAASLKNEISILKTKVLEGIPQFGAKEAQPPPQSNGVYRNRNTPRESLSEVKPSVPTSTFVPEVASMEDRPIRPAANIQPPLASSPPQTRKSREVPKVAKPKVERNVTEVARPPSPLIPTLRAKKKGEIDFTEQPSEVVEKRVPPPKSEGAPTIPPAKLKDLQPLIEVFGENNITSLFEKKWQLREGALKTIQDNLPNYAEGDASTILAMASKVVELAFEDKLLQVILAGMSLLQATIEYVNELKRPVVQAALQSVLGTVVDKTGDSNPRVRETAMKCLVFLASQSHVGASFVVSFLIKRKVQGWKPIVGKLDILSLLIPEHGFGDPETQLHRDTVISFIYSNLDHQSVEVRNAAVNGMVEAFRLDPRAVRAATANIKPQMKDILENRFKEVGETPTKAPKKKETAPPKAKVAPPVKSIETSAKPSPPSTKKSALQKNAKGPKGPRTPQAAKTPDRTKELMAAEVNPEDSFEVFTTDGSTCQFCGMEDSKFTKGGNLDLHLMRQCPMLIECSCGQVIELACLSEHLLTECDNSGEYQQCNKCKEAVHRSTLIDHKGCVPFAEDAFVRCPLCKEDVPRDEDEARWREHAMYECSENPRGVQ